MHEQKIEAVRRFLEADGLSWTSGWHRLSLLPPRRRARVLKLDERAEEFADTTRPYPYLHSVTNPQVDMTHPVAASEWLAVSWLAVTRRDLSGAQETEPGLVWRQLADDRMDSPASVRVRVGVGIALSTIAREGLVPWSGNDNPHYFDDWALLYGLASAIAHSDLDTVRKESRRLSEVTHSLDGVWCATAFAALLTHLASGMTRPLAVHAALAELPSGSWSRSVAEEALIVVSEHARPQASARAQTLERSVVDHVYSYPIAAPETLALLLAHLALADSADNFLAGLLMHPSKGDLLPALGYATSAMVSEWRQPQSRYEPALDGVAVKKLADFNLAADVTAYITQRGIAL